MNRIMPWSGLILLIGLSGVRGGSAHTEPDGPVTIEEYEERLVIRIGDDSTVLDLIQACRPFIEHEILYEVPELARPLTAMTLVTDRGGVWQRIQPILLAADLAWIRGPSNSVVARLVSLTEEGFFSNAARTVPLEEVLGESVPMAEVVTTLLALQHGSARDLRDWLRQRLSNDATDHVAAIEATNTLVLTGRGRSLSQTAQLLLKLDRADSITAPRFRDYVLENGDVGRVAEVVSHFLEARAPEGDSSAAVALPIPESSRIVVLARPLEIEALDELIEILDR